ncbi:hypothetical protein N9U05_00350 [bacterium]|nr:hypothetical protein [bacterium]
MAAPQLRNWLVLLELYSALTHLVEGLLLLTLDLATSGAVIEQALRFW